MTADSGDRRDEQHRLEERVGQQVDRMKRAEKEQHGLIGQTVYLGTLGLLFVLPVVLGAYLGSWLDSRLEGYAVHWTLSMIFTGVIVGAVNVYLFIRE